MLAHENKLPIEDGIDVINVRGLAFARFLDIARELDKEVIVVTDNDGDYTANVEDKYKSYAGIPSIKICADKDNSAATLEPQIIKVNSIEILNEVFGTKHADEESMRRYMQNNKTDCALSLFKTDADIKIPTYVQRAVM
jgi:predicted ATP-dependent endonuclease of OLD family